MKTIKRKVLVVVLMLGTLFNYANSTNFEKDVKTKIVKVIFKGAKKGNQLKIKDDKGVILHSEYVNRKGNLIKHFDFSKLENGNYTLELEKDFEIIIKSINVEGKKVVFDKENKEIIFKPLIRNKKNKLMISKIAFDKKPLAIEIYYENEKIFSENVVAEDLLNRIYRLDENKKGNYSAVVYSNGRKYVSEFNF